MDNKRHINDSEVNTETIHDSNLLLPTQSNLTSGNMEEFMENPIPPLSNKNDSEGWRHVKEWLLSLRGGGKSVVIIHHAEKNGQLRGTSSREDSSDVVLALTQPTGYRIDQGAVFNVHFEKAAGIVGEEAKAFSLEMSITESGINCKCKPLSSNPVRDERDLKLDKVL